MVSNVDEPISNVNKPNQRKALAGFSQINERKNDDGALEPIGRKCLRTIGVVFQEFSFSEAKNESDEVHSDTLVTWKYTTQREVGLKA